MILRRLGLTRMPSTLAAMLSLFAALRSVGNPWPLHGFHVGDSTLAKKRHLLIRGLLERSFGYGSIPIHTIFNGMNIHKSQLFWCELQGYYWFWHTAILGPKMGWGWSIDDPTLLCFWSTGPEAPEPRDLWQAWSTWRANRWGSGAEANTVTFFGQFGAIQILVIGGFNLFRHVLFAYHLGG